MKKTIFIFFLAVMSACSTKLLTPSQTDVERVSAKYPGYTLSELTEGKTLYENHCANCHGLKRPTSMTEDEWKKIVPEMVRKSNKKFDDKIDDKTQESILRYLITMSTASKGK